MNDLFESVGRAIAQGSGYGDKPVCIDGQPELIIDSVQSNCMPGVEPDYFCIMTNEEFCAPEE